MAKYSNTKLVFPSKVQNEPSSSRIKENDTANYSSLEIEEIKLKVQATTTTDYAIINKQVEGRRPTGKNKKGMSTQKYTWPLKQMKLIVLLTENTIHQ